jgi:hypothetical protein
MNYILCNTNKLNHYKTNTCRSKSVQLPDNGIGINDLPETTNQIVRNYLFILMQ